MAEKTKKTSISPSKSKTTKNGKTASQKQTKPKKQTEVFVFPKLKATIFLVIALIFAFGFFYQDIAERFLNTQIFGTNISTTLEEDGLKVHFIDVGQGDATAIEFPNGKTMLIDAGEAQYADEIHDYLTSSLFKQDGQLVIDYFLLTHSDSDHAGGAKFVLEQYVVNTIYRPKIYTNQEVIEQGLQNVAKHDTITYQNFVHYSKIETNQWGQPSQIIYNEVNLEISEGDAHILFLSPSNDSYGESKYNEHSPILLITYKGKRIVLTGDATIESEQEVLNYLGNVTYDIDVLKLGHHGSNTSTSLAFLEAFQPEYIIVSVGPKSTYGHPSDVVIQRLYSFGIASHNLYTTYNHGNIVVGVSENETQEVLLAIVSGVQPEKLWITWWQFSGAVLVVVFCILFASEMKQVNAIYKKTKKKAKSI